MFCFLLFLTFLFEDARCTNTIHSALAEDSGECPSGWIDSFDVDCYLFHVTRIGSWAEANLECELLGGFLAEPKRKEEVEFLTNVAQVEESMLGERSWWIGLTDMGHEGRWVWMHSLDDLEYSHWAPGSPRGWEMGLDCGLMDPLAEYEWTDKDCLHTSASPICQITKTYGTELRDGYGASSGNVFTVNSLGVFGPVCDYVNSPTWDQNAADVVCKQVGLTRGAWTTKNLFDSASSDFSMNEVTCSGSETSLQQCSYQTTDDDCNGGYEAGVYCGISADHVELTGDRNGADGVSKGNVYAVNDDGYFGPVCHHGWGSQEASVVCHQLGYSSGTPTNHSHFGYITWNAASMKYVECSGFEKSLLDCQYDKGGRGCGSATHGAGVICT